MQKLQLDRTSSREKNGAILGIPTPQAHQSPTARKLVSDLNEIEEVCINLLLTRRCQFSCEMCMYAASPNMPGNYMRWEDLEAIKGFLDTLGENLPPTTKFTVNLVGGEPTYNLERFTEILEIISHWKIAKYDEDGIYEEVPPEIEMTTNGWWLEKSEDAIAFAKAVKRHLGNDNMRIRLSNSVYHDKFRNADLQKFFGRSTPPSPAWTGHTPPNWLAELLQEVTLTKECCGNIVEAGDTCPDCQDVNDRMEYEGWHIQSLIEAAEKGQIYVDSRMMGEDKVSPVGRAKKLLIGKQDGPCHPTNDVKFTFMPTTEGEKPGRLYDPCCNGGKVALGHARDGLDLLWNRMLFIEALHIAHPIRESKNIFDKNPGQGSRCYNCPSFGAKWLRDQKPKAQNLLKQAHRLLEKTKLAEAA